MLLCVVRIFMNQTLCQDARPMAMYTKVHLSLGFHVGRSNSNKTLNHVKNWSWKKYLFFFLIRKNHFSVYFLLFPHPKIFLFFGISLSNLEKIGIDEKVICYHNISNLLWEKDVLCAWNLQTFFSIHFFFLTLEQFFLTVR